MAGPEARQGGWSPATNVADSKPWYRQFWPWVLILLPLTAVVASFTTLFIAMHDPDGLVAEDYYKAGLAINRTLERQDQARLAGIAARGQLDLATGDVVLSVDGLPASADPLTLRFAHATRSTHDQQVLLRPVPGGGRYAGQLNERLRSGAWTLYLEPAGAAWRVSGRTLVDEGATALSLTLSP
ncbi:MAG: FixH family protein [Gammaproteobacteria bacterium]|jgi:hypothetical protein|nr:FixH family protein [Gammaproteobacteria bacterium]